MQANYHHHLHWQCKVHCRKWQEYKKNQNQKRKAVHKCWWCLWKTPSLETDAKGRLTKHKCTTEVINRWYGGSGQKCFFRSLAQQCLVLDAIDRRCVSSTSSTKEWEWKLPMRVWVHYFPAGELVLVRDSNTLEGLSKKKKTASFFVVLDY